MAKEPSEEQIYEEASKKVREKKRFYRDLVTYLIVNAVLIVIWALSGRGDPWFLWPLGIWGAFVLGHFLRVFVFREKSDHEAIEKEVEKMKKGQP
jgi:fatty acid desaturase